ncbi:hypothetical protein FD754_025693, partial [Muntiacus muntjak]
MESTGGTEELVSGELVSVAHALSLPLISSVDPQFLKLTKVGDQIYSEFRENFKNLRIDILDPEELKSESAKEKWRPFCLKFDGIVEDFNYGILLRLNCSQGYTAENTIFAPRIQFFAIEIARNREGYNKAVYTGIKDKEEKEAKKKKEPTEKEKKRKKPTKKSTK